MSTTLNRPARIWLNGRVRAWDDAKVHVWTELATRGANVFEGLRALRRSDGSVAVLDLDAHVNRLFRSAELLRLPTTVDVSAIREGIVDIIAALPDFDHFYIRPTLYLEEGRYSTQVDDAVAGAYIVAVDLPPDEPVCRVMSCQISRFRKLPAETLSPLIKTGAVYQTYRLPMLEAKDAGFDEAILVGDDGRITETTGASVFAVVGGVLHTPPVSDGILDSITRANIIEVARSCGRDVVERTMYPADLHHADELFVTGTLNGVAAIGRVDDITVGSGAPGPVTGELFDALWRAYRGEPDDRWITVVERTGP